MYLCMSNSLVFIHNIYIRPVITPSHLKTKLFRTNGTFCNFQPVGRPSSGIQLVGANRGAFSFGTENTEAGKRSALYLVRSSCATNNMYFHCSGDCFGLLLRSYRADVLYKEELSSRVFGKCLLRWKCCTNANICQMIFAILE